MAACKLTGNDEDETDEEDDMPHTKGTQDFFLRSVSLPRLHLDDVITTHDACGDGSRPIVL